MVWLLFSAENLSTVAEKNASWLSRSGDFADRTGTWTCGRQNWKRQDRNTRPLQEQVDRTAERTGPE